MAIATLDIELDDFHSSDMIAELIKRAKKEPFKDEELEEIMDLFTLAFSASMESKYLEEKAKLAYLSQAFAQYELSEIESKLPIQ